jgi:hypothetical protein
VLLSLAKGPSVPSPIGLKEVPLNATFGIPQVTGALLFGFGMPSAETTSVSKARRVPSEL